MKKYLYITIVLMTIITILLPIIAIVLSFILASTYIGWIVLLSMYLYNVLALSIILIKRKRNDILINGSWIISMFIPGVGGMMFLFFSIIWRPAKKKSNYSKDLRSELDVINSLEGKVQDVKLLKNGDEKFKTLFSDVLLAKKYIYIQYFIINDGIVFKELKRILIEKAKSGVEVKIIFDPIGNVQTSNEVFKELKEAGVEIAKTNKLIMPFINGNINRRNHNKIVLIDDDILYFGGINIGDDYSHLYSKYGYWEDTHYKITGEFVSFFYKKFIIEWAKSTGKMLNNRQIVNNGNSSSIEVKVIIDNPFDKHTNFLDELINRVKNSKVDINIVTPYLIVPNSLFVEFERAVERGISINIVTTGKSDKKVAYNAATCYAERLTSIGVKVSRANSFFIHTKLYIFDNDYAFFGTSNIDYRSFFHHEETNIETSSKQLIEQFREYFIDVLRNTYLITNRSYMWGLWKSTTYIFYKLISPLL